MSDPVVDKIQTHPKYLELRKKRNSFGWGLTLLMMVVYYGFIMLVAFWSLFLVVLPYLYMVVESFPPKLPPMQRGGPSADGRSNPSGPTGANSQSALHGLSGIKVRRGCGCSCCTWRPGAETACICSEGQARVLFVKLHLNPFTRSCASLPCLPLLRSGPLLLLPAGC